MPASAIVFGLLNRELLKNSAHGFICVLRLYNHSLASCTWDDGVITAAISIFPVISSVAIACFVMFWYVTNILSPPRTVMTIITNRGAVGETEIFSGPWSLHKTIQIILQGISLAFLQINILLLVQSFLFLFYNKKKSITKASQRLIITIFSQI